jgi:hypothetical protein
MAPDKHFEPDITSTARFYQARTTMGGNGDWPAVLLDFTLLDVEPSGFTVGLRCSLDEVRKLVHPCLAALNSLEDQPASVLLQVLEMRRMRPDAPLLVVDEA